jgi:hypothetical protein
MTTQCDPSHRRDQNTTSRTLDSSGNVSSSRPSQSTFSLPQSEDFFYNLDQQMPLQTLTGVGNVNPCRPLQSTFNPVPSEPLYSQVDQQIPKQTPDTIDKVIPSRQRLQSAFKPANVFGNIAGLVKSILVLFMLTFFIPFGEKISHFVSTIFCSIVSFPS